MRVKKTLKSIKTKCPHCAIRLVLIGKPAIAKEILDMFEFSRNQKKTCSISNHFYEWPLLQQRSVPT